MMVGKVSIPCIAGIFDPALCITISSGLLVSSVNGLCQFL